MLGLSGGALATLLVAACGPGAAGPTQNTPTPAGRPVSPTTAPAGASATPGAPVGVVFNTASKDVTLFDPGANRVTGTRPISAVVRWLSNEQHYWDGTHVWTYDFPDNRVQAIAIDPKSFQVSKQIPVDGKGPGHSFVLTPDNKRGFVNSAGSNFLAVVDPVAGRVLERLETGAFP